MARPLLQQRGMSQRHQNLVAWQRADDLFIRIHRDVCPTFPSEERYELASQLRRAAFSVPANIVEGFARRSPRERARFLNIAEASLAEVGYCLHVASRLGYLGGEEYEVLLAEVQRAAGPLVGLLRAVLSGADRPG